MAAGVRDRSLHLAHREEQEQSKRRLTLRIRPCSPPGGAASAARRKQQEEKTQEVHTSIDEAPYVTAAELFIAESDRQTNVAFEKRVQHNWYSTVVVPS